MTFGSRVALAAVVLAASSAAARADSITAVGQGWCTPSSCNASAIVGLNNTFAGSHSNGLAQSEYRDWFAFDIPATGAITGAILNVWNASANYTDAAGTFELRTASARTFAGLFGATILGTVDVGIADNGTSRYVGIPLNLAGLDLLNAARGSRVLFGGVVTPFTPTQEVQIFGYTQGPPAAFLDLTRDPAPVPEPSTVLMVITGALALGSSARARREVAARLVRR